MALHGLSIYECILSLMLWFLLLCPDSCLNCRVSLSRQCKQRLLNPKDWGRIRWDQQLVGRLQQGTWAPLHLLGMMTGREHLPWGRGQERRPDGYVGSNLLMERVWEVRFVPTSFKFIPKTDKFVYEYHECFIVNDADQFVCIDNHLYTPVTSTEVTVQYNA